MVTDNGPAAVNSGTEATRVNENMPVNVPAGNPEEKQVEEPDIEAISAGDEEVDVVVKKPTTRASRSGQGKATTATKRPTRKKTKKSSKSKPAVADLQDEIANLKSQAKRDVAAVKLELTAYTRTRKQTVRRKRPR